LTAAAAPVNNSRFCLTPHALTLAPPGVLQDGTAGMVCGVSSIIISAPTQQRQKASGPSSARLTRCNLVAAARQSVRDACACGGLPS
jgi:hypothetical protein